MVALLVAGATGATGLAPLAAQRGPTPSGDEQARAEQEVSSAEAELATAQAEADRAADAYFSQRERVAALEIEIATTEAEIERSRRERVALEAVVRERAAIAYKQTGTATVLPEGSAASDELAAGRREVLLDTLNDKDNEAVGDLVALSDDLAAARERLDADRREQRQTLDRLRADQAELDALILEAKTRYDEAVARRLALAEAQRRAEEEEAAARAREAAATAEAEAAAASEAEAAEAEAAGSGGATAPASAGAPPEAAPAPAPGYQPSPGQHPQHSHPFLVCTRRIESSGNYRALSPGGTYRGAYQFDRSTWNGTANHAGRFELVGVDPIQASEYDQDDMAWTLYQWRGSQPWNGRCG